MDKNRLVPGKNFAIQKINNPVDYLSPEEIYQIADSIKDGRNGERNSLLVLTLFQTGLRISECISLTPAKISQYMGCFVISVIGKGNKPRKISCPEGLANKLMAYAYKRGLKPEDRIFDINRQRAWQIIKKAGKQAGVTKRIYPHLFRHSDAIYRLRKTGNPKALQYHLGHSALLMTMRYLSTLQEEEALKIESEVKFNEYD